MGAGRAALLLAALAVGPLAGCGGDRPGGDAATRGAPTVGSEGGESLVAWLRRGAAPGDTSTEEREAIEEAVRELLPQPAGDLAGHQWRVTYHDLPTADFVSAELVPDEPPGYPRALWMHLVWRGPLEPAARGGYRREVAGYPARGLPGHHVFVRAGGVEVRAVAEAEAMREEGRLEALVAELPLARLAED
ncbi:MAG TPA: hypothetical protein VMT16_13300 [Thermoanaerobaculia bacterium]|nr:hypothetical protein [Thermoanaerobaculia bacterium]